MKLSRFLWFVLFGTLLMMNGTRVAAKKRSKAYFKLVEAYTQRTIAGRPGAPAETGDHFIIVWKHAQYPETFFWRGDGGWLSCKMLKAHKVKGRSGIDYRTEYVDNGQVHKGDTLELIPVLGGKFPVPAEIPANAKNTIFFKTGGSGWLSCHVNKITRKKDISLP